MNVCCLVGYTEIQIIINYLKAQSLVYKKYLIYILTDPCSFFKYCDNNNINVQNDINYNIRKMI